MHISEISWVFIFLLPIIAFLYSSVGHGGASGYLALMALFSFSPNDMKPTALLLNIFVSGISFWFFKKNSFFKWKLFLPFSLGSIPAAFIGGYLSINSILYKKTLGILLIFAILRMLGFFGKSISNNEIKFGLGVLIGICTGFFSGMIGIGGGIILSPLILLLGWGSVKEAAATSALFIFVNSTSGMIGYVINNGDIPQFAFYLIFLAIIGGFVGAYYGSSKISSVKLTYLLAFVLVIASIKLMLV